MWNSKQFVVKRISTVMMGILILAVLLLSSFYITAESGHDCSGTDCPVCACIQQCETILHRSGNETGLQTAAVTVAFFYLLCKLPENDLMLVTPVSQKIRMNH